MIESPSTSGPALSKLPVGIPGFDQISLGGLPAGRVALLAGTAGSGKTLLALQYLVAGARDHGQTGVFVTFEESPKDLIANVESFGWALDELIAEGRLAVVDASADPWDDVIEAGSFDLSALMARIEAAVRRVGAERVILDAVGGLFPQFADPQLVRRELHRIFAGLRQLGVTTLVTVERLAEQGSVARFGIEEFVADNVLILRNRLEGEKRRRTIEILKFRGAPHQKGEFPYTITVTDGIIILPLSSIELEQHSSDIRTSSGVAELDKMCGGGLFRDSIVLASGATGTGKTLMVTMFVKAAIEAGDRALIIAAEESREQLSRNAASWGVDMAEAERQGLLRIICRYPESMGLEDHLLQIQRDIDDFRPTRIAVDSLSAFERVATEKSFREFVIGLTSHIKHCEITGLITNTTSMLLGGESITETHVSTITDSIILLRYVELQGAMRRGLTVLKMRGTAHEKQIREYRIDGDGLHILEPFHGVSGILSGNPTYSYRDEKRNLGGMFEDPAQ